MLVVDELCAAGAFLTRVPLGRTAAARRSGLAFFPLVGGVVGAASGGVTWLGAEALSAPLAAALGIAASALLTGALHLDGLADTADSFGGTTADERKAIAKDQSLGSYGALALMIDQLAKFAALITLARHPGIVAATAAAGGLSRAAPLAIALFLSPASDTGLAQALNAQLDRRLASAALLATPALLLAIVPGRLVLFDTLAACLLTLVVAWWMQTRLGGMNGDGLGAAVEVVETTLLIVAVGVAG
jgi:adenosylcobinamide-GDP ribazoletransferase